MKKLKKYEGDPAFITIFEKGFNLINDGYYIIKGDKGTYVHTNDHNKNGSILIKISSDYYVFEMNDEFRNDKALLKNFINYNQINLRNISNEEYDKYMKS